ncbi:hypothetical protein BC624_10629 [Flavobacterium granuli]|uniref:Uncharacterized protein n=1 Tax=Flavobacterium granuli TaxID=280093 RepID=A0A1M5RSE2_9FLAO|nr:hypothetical protein BC624_10629 [Flavobacterium granuli]SHH28713.1 hypothetical protein SAMN05443373_11093 [Flavobacterium granuli]
MKYSSLNFHVFKRIDNRYFIDYTLIVSQTKTKQIMDFSRLLSTFEGQPITHQMLTSILS